MPSFYQVDTNDLTTLYNSGEGVLPTGVTSGNLNVTGNLTVQGNSLFIGPVTLQNTLCLPNYCFPTPDGTTGQVMTTDGAGNLYWSTVSALAGTYTIQADTTSGGGNLTLVNSLGPTDSVKFASGTGITVSRTDASTLTITNTSPAITYNIDASTATGGANLNLTGSDSTTDTVKFAAGSGTSITRTDANTITIAATGAAVPSGTANGQVLVWESGAWTADSEVTADTAAARLTAVYKNSAAGVNNGLFVRKDYSTGTYTTGDGTGVAFQLQSNTQATNQYATVNATWNATAPTINLSTNINNNTAGPFVSAGTFSSAQATLPGDLAVNGGDITTTQTTASVFNTTPTTVNAFGAATAITMAAATGTTTIRNNLSIDGETLKVNADGTAADSFLYMKGTSNYLKWNDAGPQFEFSDPIFATNPNIADIPGVFERRTTTAQINVDTEAKSALNIIERVTDAGSNATDQGGTGIKYSRTSGTSGGAQTDYAAINAIYYGTTNTADFRLVWSNDNFNEPTPGNFPGTYTLLRAGSNDAEFYNNSIFIDYSAQSVTDTATSITGSNTLVFGTAHGYTAGQRIQFTSTTQNGLTQNAYYYVLSTGLTTTQCQLGTTANGSAIALTNGTGLTLVFATLTNQVGINNSNPAHTLDVDGDIYASGDVYVDGVQVQISSPNKGNLLYYDGTKFTDSSLIEFDNATYRIRFQNNAGTSGAINHALTATKKTTGTGGGSWVNGDGSGMLIGLSDTNTTTLFGSVAAVWDTTGNYQMRLRTSNDGFVSNIRNVFTADNTNATVKAQTFTLNAEGTASAAVDAFLTVERGTTGNDVSIKWNEEPIPANSRWQFTNDGTTYYNIPINIDDLADVVITPPTAAGQFLFNNGTNWINDNKVTSTASADRAVFEYKLNSNGFNATLFARRNTGTSAYTTGDGAGIGFQLASDSQAQTSIGAMYVINDTAPYFSLNTSTDNFTTNTQVAKIDSAAVKFNGTTLTLDANNTGAAVNGTFAVSRGSSADATITWANANDQWEMSNGLFVSGDIIALNDLGTNGNAIYFNYDDVSAADSYLTVKRNPDPDVSIRWNQATQRWQDTTDGTNYFNLPNQNLDTTDDVAFSSVEIDGISTYNTQTTTTTATTATSISATTRITEKVIINIVDNITGNRHVCEALAFRQGTTAYLTTYAEMYNSTALATFTADVSGGSTRILATPASTNSTTFTVARFTLD